MNFHTLISTLALFLEITTAVENLVLHTENQHVRVPTGKKIQRGFTEMLIVYKECGIF